MSRARKLVEITSEALIAAMPPKPPIPRGSWSTQPVYLEGGSPITTTEDNGCVGVLWPTTAIYDRRGRKQFRYYFGWRVPFQPKKGNKLVLFMNQKMTANFGMQENWQSVEEEHNAQE